MPRIRTSLGHQYRIRTRLADASVPDPGSGEEPPPPPPPPPEATIPAAPSDLVATPLSESTIRLQFVDNSLDETGFHVYVDGALRTSVGAGVVQVDVSGLVASTAYVLGVSAFNDAGESAKVEVSATTLDAPAPPPPEEEPGSIPLAPTALTATPTSPTNVSLSWQDNSDNEAGFRLRRDGILLATLDPDIVTLEDGTAASGKTYVYSVVAFNEVGESTAVSATVTMPVASSGELSAPEALIVKPLRVGKARLTWRRPVGATIGTGWRIERSSNGVDFVPLQLPVSPYTLSDWFKSGFTQLTASYFEANDLTAPNGAVFYRVVETSGGGVESAASEVSGTTMPSDDFTPVLPLIEPSNIYSVPVGGTLWQPADGAAFAAALADSAPGDVIELQAGVEYKGSFTIPAKDNPLEKWLYITTSDIAGLPPVGTRVKATDSVHMPLLHRQFGGTPVITFAEGASYVRLVGLDLEIDDSSMCYNVLLLGSNYDILAHHIRVDRCLVHGNPVSNLTQRGIALNVGDCVISDSLVFDVKLQGECQGICGWNAEGPILIDNCRVEAASIPFMLGGATPSVEGRVAQDITIRRCYFVKPTAWEAEKLSVKNLFEIKSCRRLLMEGCVLKRTWPIAQSTAVVIKSSPDEKAYWTFTSDITIRNCLVKEGASCVVVLGFDSAAQGISGRDFNPPSSHDLTARVKFSNLVFEEFVDITLTGLGSGYRFFQHFGGPNFVTVEHVTHFSGDYGKMNSMILFSSGAVAEGFRFLNNVVRHQELGVFGDGADSINSLPGFTVGNNQLNAYVPSQLEFTGNVIDMTGDNSGADAGDYPPGNEFPADRAAIVFAAAGYGLDVASPYRVGGANYVGTDGTDPGVDDAALQAAIAGVVD